jgi:glycosyltransferase involved in cell wall biosynthesis
MNASVAVVITTYNHAHFLNDALDSIMAQSQAASEILVVDDGSADNPSSIVARYPDVKLHWQPNSGLAAARNLGLMTTKAEKIIFLDADDRLLPNAIVHGLTCFQRTPDAALVYGAHRFVNGVGKIISEIKYEPISEDAYQHLLRANCIRMHATAMYDRRKLLNIGGFDPKLECCEDYDVYLRLARHYPIASHTQLVAEYRRHGNNLSADHKRMLKWALLVHKRQAPTAFAQNESRNAWREGRRKWRHYYSEQILGDMQRSWPEHKSLPRVGQAFLAGLAASPYQTGRWIMTKCLSPRVLYRLKRLKDKNAVPPPGGIRLGDLDRTSPISTSFGFDRGTPIDRYYIDRFLQRHAAVIRGRVLEIGSDLYSRRYGAGRITHQDILDIDPSNVSATIVGDLSKPLVLPQRVFDCIVLTQTLQLIYDLGTVVEQVFGALAPGGTLLLTTPGISQIDKAWSDSWYWSLTHNSAVRLFSDCFGHSNIEVETYGNIFAATAFLHGIALEEVDKTKLGAMDPSYPIIIAVCARKALPDAVAV